MMAKIKPKRKLLPIMHIYCEGEKTEPYYLEKYLRKFHDGDRRRQVIQIEPTRKNTPVQLVDEAITHKKSRSTPEQDVFWVIYDREAIAKYPDEKHEIAWKKAKAAGVNVAISNVCFELWILLHFVRNTASYSSYNDLMSNSALKIELLRAGLPKYDKGEKKIFDFIGGDADIAKQNAIDMNKITIASAADPDAPHYLLNPFTSVPYLLNAIDEFE